MEASAVRHVAGAPALAGRSPLLRLQSDEKLVALIRRGHHGAFEALVNRYNSRLLAFCRHMLGNTEDAEDVLQEVFTAAFNAICADERPINARPWLYRIARNRCLNHLRRPQHAGQDSMDIFERDGGATTADTVHTREEFRQIVTDVQQLPESQRSALLLREIDALSYEQIAEAMDTTVPSVKSLLVRARVSLAEAAEARLLTCEEVRLELGQVAEGLVRTSPPVRRHLRTCDRCTLFRRELRNTSRALAAVYPIGLLVVVKKFVLAKLGAMGGAAAGGGAAAAGGGAAATGGAAAAGTRRRGRRGHRRRHDLRGHRHRGHQGRGRACGGGDRHGRRRGGQAGPPAPGGPGEPREGRRGRAARPAGRLLAAAAHGRGARAPPRRRRPSTTHPPPSPSSTRPAATPAEPVAGQPQLGTTDQGGSTVTLPQQPGPDPGGSHGRRPDRHRRRYRPPAPIVTPAPPATSSDPAVVGTNRQPGPTAPPGRTAARRRPADDPDIAPPPDDGDSSSTQDPPPPAG